MTTEDRILTALVEAIGRRIAPREDVGPTRGGSSPEATLADLRDWGWDVEAGPGGSLFLRQVRSDTGPLPRWLRRHLAEHWAEIGKLVAQQSDQAASFR